MSPGLLIFWFSPHVCCIPGRTFHARLTPFPPFRTRMLEKFSYYPERVIDAENALRPCATLLSPKYTSSVECLPALPSSLIRLCWIIYRSAPIKHGPRIDLGIDIHKLLVEESMAAAANFAAGLELRSEERVGNKLKLIKKKMIAVQ